MTPPAATSDRPRDSRNRDPVEIPLDGAAFERVDIARRTGRACGVDHMGSGQTGDVLLGTKSSRRYRRQYLAPRQRNDISPAIGNRSAGDPQRVSAGRPPYHGVTADDDRRPAPERQHLDDCLSVARTRSPCLDPPAVGRDTPQTEDRLLPRLAQSRPVRLNTVHKPGGPLRVAEEDFAAWAKVRAPALHTGDLPGRRAPVKRRQPEVRFPFAVFRFHHHLLTVGGNVIVKRLKAGCQGLGMSGVQVCYPQFAWISYNSVAELFAIRCKLWISGVALEQRNLPLAVRVVNPYGSALQCHGRDEGPAVRCHGDPFLLGQSGSKLLGLAVRKPLAPDVIESSGLGCEVHPLSIGRPCSRCAGCPRRPHLVARRTAVHRSHAAPVSYTHLTLPTNREV